MRLAVEGADCTGKSTFIKELVKQQGTDPAVIHISGQPTEDYYRELHKLPEVIFDRFVLGDMVYNKPRMLSEEFIVQQLQSLDTLYIMDTHPQTHKQRCTERGELDDFAEFRSDARKFNLVMDYLLVKYEKELGGLNVQYIRK